MLDQLLTQFLDHLRYERNVSAHTLRNYESDLLQFFDYLASADPGNVKRKHPDIRQIDHLTIREWLATLHSDKKKKTSIARKLAALRTFFQFLVREGVVELNPAKLVATPRKEKKLPVHLSIEDAVRFIETPDSETDFGQAPQRTHCAVWRSGRQGSKGIPRRARKFPDECAGHQARCPTFEFELPGHAHDDPVSGPSGGKIHSPLRRYT